MKKDTYTEEMSKILEDKETYLEIKKDPTTRFEPKKSLKN